MRLINRRKWPLKVLVTFLSRCADLGVGDALPLKRGLGSAARSQLLGSPRPAAPSFSLVGAGVPLCSGAGPKDKIPPGFHQALAQLGQSSRCLVLVATGKSSWRYGAGSTSVWGGVEGACPCLIDASKNHCFREGKVLTSALSHLVVNSVSSSNECY